MIVHRQTFVVKFGQMAAAVEILKTGADHLETKPNFRVYGSALGPHNTVVLELEFEDLTEYETFWSNWGAAPESATVNENWQQVVQQGGVSEIWNLY